MILYNRINNVEIRIKFGAENTTEAVKVVCAEVSMNFTGNASSSRVTQGIKGNDHLLSG